MSLSDDAEREGRANVCLIWPFSLRAMYRASQEERDSCNSCLGSEGNYWSTKMGVSHDREATEADYVAAFRSMHSLCIGRGACQTQTNL